MGLFKIIKDVVNIATLGQVTIVEKLIEHGDKIVKVTIDVTNEIVRIGEEIFRAAPGEVFFPGLGPLAGLLKNEIEDELILLNPFGVVPTMPSNVFFGVDPLGAVLVVGDLIGKVQHRTMFDDEREIARYVFRDSLRRVDEIRLTNLTGLDGNPFAAPSHAGGALVNLGKHYVHDHHIDNIPLLLHELTHIWQIERSVLTEIAVCKGLITAIKDELGEDVYSFAPGSQWSTYSTEQQASIVEAWSLGATSLDDGWVDERARNLFAIGSPLFRYINGNVRRSSNGAQTGDGRSVRQLLANGGYRSMRDMHSKSPLTWWA